MSRQRPVPASAASVLRSIPEHFVDDGCSNSPDSIFGFDFRWACRIHDWRYCTRCHPPGHMTQEERRAADSELRENIRASLPWRWRWVGWFYRAAVRWYGGRSAWNSCGPVRSYQERLVEVELCRHGMTKPEWMARDTLYHL